MSLERSSSSLELGRSINIEGYQILSLWIFGFWFPDGLLNSRVLSKKFETWRKVCLGLKIDWESVSILRDPFGIPFRVELESSGKFDMEWWDEGNHLLSTPHDDSEKWTLSRFGLHLTDRLGSTSLGINLHQAKRAIQNIDAAIIGRPQSHELGLGLLLDASPWKVFEEQAS